MMRPRRILAAVAAGLVFSALPSAPAHAVDPATSHGYLELIGSLHEHSGYSDGWPGTTPKTYFDKARGYGIDFLGSGEHSDTADIPMAFSDGCLSEEIVKCPGPGSLDEGEPSYADSLRKWDATLEQARAASKDGFVGFRGFEWTSDRFGHINVYFSKNDANAKTDGGYATMDNFYKWFTTRPELGGGSDGLATFNHPGDKRLDEIDEPLGTTGVYNWNDFAYVPEADDRMVGIELYNDDKEYGLSHRQAFDPPEGYYVHALDKGWHVGAIGAEDLHGEPSQGRDTWGGPQWAKTVVLASDRSEASIRSALLARRFYAIRDNDGPRLTLDFSIDGQIMGSRLVRGAGTPLHIVATTDRPGAAIEVVTTGGTVVATGSGSIDTTLPAASTQRYYFMRVKENGNWVGYGSPVWVSQDPQSAVGEWLAGDLHVHTCYSHDAYCPTEVYGPLGYNPEGGDNTGPDEFYTLSGTVEERFLEASVRGLDYLAITDHDRIEPVTDPGFGTHGVIGVPGYEYSIAGHAQMLGATKKYSVGDGTPAAVRAMADELRRDGGVFQANHPADPTDNTYKPLDEGCDTSEFHWKYGYDVPVDTVEVWNIGNVLQPPAPAGTSNEDALRYWECWLDRGVRVGATGGSDSHWLSTAAIQGPGNPTTWVFASERSPAGVLQALREGRTTISLTPPAEGELRLVLEANLDGDDAYEAMVGDTVPPGTPMRVRAEGLLGAGLVRVRANDETIVDNEPIGPGGSITFPAPDEPGWVHATLLGPDATEQRKEHCDPVAAGLEQAIDDDPIPDDPFGDFDSDIQQRTTYCRNHIAVLAQTSAMYVAVPTTITFEALAAHGETVRLAAKLTEDDGDPLSGKTVTFTIRDVSARATTNGEGVAQTTLDVPDHGRSQIARASYAGELWYGASSATAVVLWGIGSPL
jgi:histidinol phosphatase-like PHP family hydrolase